MAGELSDLGIVADGQDEYVAGLRKRCSGELQELERRCEAAADDQERADLCAQMEAVHERYLELERQASFSLF